MKNYQEFISELNKYEKETVKKARGLFIKKLGVKKYVQQGLSKLNKANPFMKSNAYARSMPENPYVSPRRESENIIARFQDTEPGQKGAGNRVDPKTGKVTRYNPTLERHGEMRGLSKSKAANIQKILRKSGADQQGYSLDTVHKNLGGSQNRRIYQKAFSGTELEKVAGDLDVFPKTKTTGAPTTTNIPKGKIPEPPKVNPPSTFKPPKGSVGAMKTTKTPNFISKGRNLLGKVSKIKNKKAAALAFGAGALAGGIAAYRNRNKVEESRASETTTKTKGGRVISISKKDIGTSAQYNRDVINKLPSLGGEKIQVDAGGKVPDIGKFYNDISQRYTGKKIDPNKINRNIPGTRANDLKNIEQSINKTFESKITSSPYINKDTGIEDKNWDGTVKAGPTIHFGGKRKGKYPNNILDLKDDDPLKKQYFNEPETKEYFKNNPTIKMKFYGEDEPRTYTNPYKKSESKKGVSAINAPKGVFPKG